MRRRDFMILLAGAIGGGQSAVRAQQKGMPVIGILGATSPEIPLVAANLAGFRQGLGETGYVEGQNPAAADGPLRDKARVPALYAHPSS